MVRSLAACAFAQRAWVERARTESMRTESTWTERVADLVAECVWPGSREPGRDGSTGRGSTGHRFECCGRTACVRFGLRAAVWCCGTRVSRVSRPRVSGAPFWRLGIVVLRNCEIVYVRYVISERGGAKTELSRSHRPKNELVSHTELVGGLVS